MAVLFNDDSVYTVTVPVTSMPITFYCLFYVTNLSLNRYLMSIEENGGDQWYRLYNAGDHVTAYRRNGGSTKTIGVTSSHFLSTWYAASTTFLHPTYNSVYLDGGSKGINTDNCTPDGAQFNIFKFGANDFEGRLAELAVWDVALNDDEHATLGLHTRGNFVRPDDLVFYASLESDYYEEIGDQYLLTGGDPSFVAHPPLFSGESVFGPKVQVV